MSQQLPDMPEVQLELKDLTREYWIGFRDGQLSMKKYMLQLQEADKEKSDEQKLI